MISLPVEQSSLFLNDCVQNCDMYNDVCMGSPSAPCGCIKETLEERYDCENCYVLCRERRSPSFSVEKQLAEGIGLEELILTQKRAPTYPLFIPLSTHEAHEALPLTYAAVDARNLFNQAKRTPAKPKRFLTDGSSVKEYLRLSQATKLVAVLNGQDRHLERFWGMPRGDFFSLLVRADFRAVTGPTFSVTQESNGFPAFHNILMQRRHHMVMQEIQQAGLFAVPNIYWRNEGEIQGWADWLIKNENVNVVTRDFSRTKPTKLFEKELAGLVRILAEPERRFHVLLVGAGVGNGPLALRQLSQIGCTASIISSHPIREAISKGRRMSIGETGDITHFQDLTASRDQLIPANLATMESYLLSCVSKLPLYEGVKPILFNLFSPKVTLSHKNQQDLIVT